jgi:hypothetical protein
LLQLSGGFCGRLNLLGVYGMGLNCDLYFPLPVQKDKNKGQRKLELERFREVLNNLPYGDQERAAHELFNILHRANRIEFRSDERLALLLQVEAPAFQILSGLQEKIKDLAAPIRRNEERIAKLLVGTHFELALAYRSLLVKPPVKGVLRTVDHQALANYLRLAIYHLGEVLRTKYNAMNNPGGTIWRYIYGLFACAYQLGIHELRLPSLSWCRSDTVEDTFKSILLLAISSPLTMRGSHFNALYQLAPDLTSYLELGKIRCGEGYTNLATFSLSATEPPKKQIMSGCESCANASNCFTLSTEPLLGYIKQQLELGRRSKQPTPLQKFLQEHYQLDGLLRNLGGYGKADHNERIAGADFSVDIVVGFNEANATLCQDNQDARDNTAEDITVEDTDQWTNTGITGTEQRRTECMVMNHSSGGYCLYIDANERFHIRVGELAIVREPGAVWRPAVISWVSGDKGRMDFGIKLLGESATPAVLRPIYNSTLDGAVDCLLVEDGDMAERPARIVTSSADLAKGDTLLVRSGDREYKVSVSHIQTRSNGYAEHCCDWEKGPESTAAGVEVATDDQVEPGQDLEQATDFDSLWTKL